MAKLNQVSLLMTLPHSNIDVRQLLLSSTFRTVQASITRVPMAALAAPTPSPCSKHSEQGAELPEHHLHGPSTAVQVTAAAFTLNNFIQLWVTD